MAYTPTPWVDGTTPVNAANLNKLEQGVLDADTVAAAAIPSAQKAAVNGVASLDSGGKVPLTQLPSGLGGGVDYIGDWGAGVAYKQGDVVRYNGVDYVAVNPSTGQTPPPLAPLSYPGPSYGLTLPATPQDGQEAILVDSLTSPTYQWRFRYNAGSSSPYKWEFIGGAPAIVETNVADAGMTFTTYTTPTTPGPDFTVPRAGDYGIDFAASLASSAAGTSAYASLAFGATAAVDADALQYAPGWQGPAARFYRKNALAAGTLIATKFRVGAGNGNLINRALKVTPVRVA